MVLQGFVNISPWILIPYMDPILFTMPTLRAEKDQVIQSVAQLDPHLFCSFF